MDPIRLHMNELPWPPPEAVVNAAKTGLRELNRYADESKLQDLRNSLGQYTGINPERVILSPGSDILLREVVHLFSSQRKVITLCPSFLPTVRSARQTARSMSRIRLPLPDFRLDMEILESEIQGPCLLIMDNPNNPTGQTIISSQQVERLLQKKDLLLIMDEAYYEFAGITCADLVEKYENLLVTRTVDKVFSLAGARLGFGLAGEIFRMELSSFFIYLPRTTLYAALAALDSLEIMRERVEIIKQERDRMLGRLLEEEVEVYGTSANFLLIRTPIPDVLEKLKNRGILIKDISDQMPAGFIRVTIGKKEENDIFLKEYLALQEESF